MSDESLLNDLNARIEAAIQCVMSNWEHQLCQQNLTFIADLNSEASKQFKSEEIEFFDLELNQSLDEDNIVFIDKEVWIQNVFIFTQWIKNVISLKKEETVWSNLFICLKEAAQCWYSDELNDHNKIALHIDFQ